MWRPEIRQPEIRQPEIRRPEIRRPEIRQFSKTNNCGKLISLVADLNFTAIGLLAILMEEFPLGRGHINFQQFSDVCHVAKSALKTQIRALEQKGLIKLGPIQQTGRDLTIVFALQAEESKTTE